MVVAVAALAWACPLQGTRRVELMGMHLEDLDLPLGGPAAGEAAARPRRASARPRRRRRRDVATREERDKPGRASEEGDAERAARAS